MSAVPRTLLSHLVVLFALAGCRVASPEWAGVEVYDSAGVQIVHSRSPAWQEGAGWHLDPVPIVAIGEADGAEEYLLFTLVGAVRLGDGRIVVANRGSQELRYYDAGGRFLGRAGGAGEGPGEFRNLGRPERMPGDSIAVFDQSLQRRVSIFAPSGRFARSFNLQPHEIGPPLFAGSLADGSFVLRASRTFRASDEPRGLSRDSIAYYAVSGEGAPLRTLVQVLGSQNYQPPPGLGVTVMTPVFGRVTSAALHGGGLHVGLSDRFEIESWDGDGRLVRIIRREHAPRPVGPGDIAAIVQQRIENTAISRQNMEEIFRQYPFPETFPAYQSMRVDGAGHLWVGHYRWPAEGDFEWSVFAPDGRWLGTVHTPADLVVYEIGADYLLGRRTDELGIERVEMVRLIKP